MCVGWVGYYMCIHGLVCETNRKGGVSLLVGHNSNSVRVWVIVFLVSPVFLVSSLGFLGAVGVPVPGVLVWLVGVSCIVSIVGWGVVFTVATVKVTTGMGAGLWRDYGVHVWCVLMSRAYRVACRRVREEYALKQENLGAGSPVMVGCGVMVAYTRRAIRGRRLRVKQRVIVPGGFMVCVDPYNPVGLPIIYNGWDDTPTTPL